jgi:hypothetical protein
MKGGEQRATLIVIEGAGRATGSGQLSISGPRSSGMVEFRAMRTNVAPFLWFLAAFTFAVVWGQQHKTAYVLLAVVFAILAVRSYAATKKGAV